MAATTLEERVGAQERLGTLLKRRTLFLVTWRRREIRARREQGVRLERIERRLDRLHATLVAGVFTLLAAFIGGVFDVLAHLHP